MSIKTFKPTTPSRRQMTVSGFDGIDKKARPEPSLTEPLKKNSGRNSYGRITVRHRGGGNKRKTKKGRRGVSLLSMAWANLGRSRGKTAVTVTSLSLAVVLLTVTVNFTSAAYFFAPIVVSALMVT